MNTAACSITELPVLRCTGMDFPRIFQTNLSQTNNENRYGIQQNERNQNPFKNVISYFIQLQKVGF